MSNNMTSDELTSSFIADFGAVYELLNVTYNASGFEVDPDTQPCLPPTLPFVPALLISVFYCVAFMLALPGNLCVWAVIVIDAKRPLLPSDLYLLHLALADLVLAITLPFWATSVSAGWLFGDALCKLITVLQELSFYASILFLGCISVDRYLVIVRALETRRMKRRLVSWLVCTLVWLSGAFLSLPGLFSSAHASLNSSQTVCHELFDPSSADSWRLATRVLRHSLGFLGPLTVMSVCYGITVRRLLQVRGGFRKQRVMRVIAVVVAAFLLCWTPYHVAVMADTVLRSGLVHYGCEARLAVDRALLATHSLGLLHGCVNPVVYAFVSEKFRTKFLLILQKRGLRRKRTAPRTSSVSSEITSTFI